jgi:hypothetical protein
MMMDQSGYAESLQPAEAGLGKRPGFYANITAPLRDFYGFFTTSLPPVCHTLQRHRRRRRSPTPDGRYALAMLQSAASTIAALHASGARGEVGWGRGGIYVLGYACKTGKDLWRDLR